MVFYSKRSLRDFECIFRALLKWKPKKYLYPVLTFDEVVSYRNDLNKQCLSIANVENHKTSYYEIHKKYGKFVISYKRNKNTMWYIIYDVKSNGDILIKKIMNNHKTISGTRT